MSLPLIGNLLLEDPRTQFKEMTSLVLQFLGKRNQYNHWMNGNAAAHYFIIAYLSIYTAYGLKSWPYFYAQGSVSLPLRYTYIKSL